MPEGMSLWSMWFHTDRLTCIMRGLLRIACRRLASSAAVYFHRFYLRGCFCRADPRLVFVGCLYLASKAEESALAAKHMVTYAKKMRPGWVYDIKHLLDIEMVRLSDNLRNTGRIGGPEATTYWFTGLLST